MGASLLAHGGRASEWRWLMQTDTPHWHTDYWLGVAESVEGWYTTATQKFEHHWAELLKEAPHFLMKKAGVYRIYLGIESINNRSLNAYNKKQRVEDIEESIEIISKNGLEIFASLVLGSDEDTAETVRDTYSFLIRHKVHAICMLSLYDFPGKERALGTPQVFPDSRFIHNDWRFYNGNFVIHYPRRMRPSVLQEELIRGTRRFYSLKRRVAFLLARGSVDYFAQFCSLGPVLKTMERYAEILKRYELGLYDANDMLITEKLPDQYDPRRRRYLPV